MASRCGPWRCFDSFLLLVALLMTFVAITCWFTVFPRAFSDPDRHGGKYPDYEETECRLHGDPHHENSREDDEHDVECSRNNRNEWCDADDTWWEGHRRQKRSWGGRHRRFPCIKVRVSFIFRGSKLTGILYESWLEAENFQRCSTSSCLTDRRENEEHVRKWKQQLGHRFRCYVNRHKPEEVVLRRDDISCLAGKPGFHAVLWPALIAGICFLWLIIRRCRLCCCQAGTRGYPKVKPDMEGIYVPENQAGPLPEKNALDLGTEVILSPPIGPPPTYDGHYKDVDTVSMMSVPPAYDVNDTSQVGAVAKVDT